MRVETLLRHESRRFQPEAWQVCHCSRGTLMCLRTDQVAGDCQNDASCEAEQINQRVRERLLTDTGMATMGRFSRCPRRHDHQDHANKVAFVESRRDRTLDEHQRHQRLQPRHLVEGPLQLGRPQRHIWAAGTVHPDRTCCRLWGGGSRFMSPRLRVFDALSG